MLMSNSYIKYQDLILLFLSVITNDENVSFAKFKNVGLLYTRRKTSWPGIRRERATSSIELFIIKTSN